MKITIKFLLIGCFITICNSGFSQCPCADIRIIELKDTVTALGQVAFTFKLTSDSSNCNTGYSDFWFVDQVGDTINEWTGSGMWMPNPIDPMFDTTEYIIELKPGYSSFPASFSGNLQVWNPDCTIPFTLATLTTNETIDLEPDIQLFPNPSSGEVKILNKSNLIITSLKVYESTGKLILSKTEKTDLIGIEDFKSGIYYIKLYSNEKVIVVKKLIKN